MASIPIGHTGQVHIELLTVTESLDRGESPILGDINRFDTIEHQVHTHRFDYAKQLKTLPAGIPDD